MGWLVQVYLPVWESMLNIGLTIMLCWLKVSMKILMQQELRTEQSCYTEEEILTLDKNCEYCQIYLEEIETHIISSLSWYASPINSPVRAKISFLVFFICATLQRINILCIYLGFYFITVLNLWTINRYYTATPLIYRTTSSIIVIV